MVHLSGCSDRGSLPAELEWQTSIYSGSDMIGFVLISDVDPDPLVT